MQLNKNCRLVNFWSCELEESTCEEEGPSGTNTGREYQNEHGKEIERKETERKMSGARKQHNLIRKY